MSFNWKFENKTRKLTYSTEAWRDPSSGDPYTWPVRLSIPWGERQRSADEDSPHIRLQPNNKRPLYAISSISSEYPFSLVKDRHLIYIFRRVRWTALSVPAPEWLLWLRQRTKEYWSSSSSPDGPCIKTISFLIGHTFWEIILRPKELFVCRRAKWLCRLGIWLSPRSGLVYAGFAVRQSVRMLREQEVKDYSRHRSRCWSAPYCRWLCHSSFYPCARASPHPYFQWR